jgi:hypothetical protein
MAKRGVNAVKTPFPLVYSRRVGHPCSTVRQIKPPLGAGEVLVGDRSAVVPRDVARRVEVCFRAVSRSFAFEPCHRAAPRERLKLNLWSSGPSSNLNSNIIQTSLPRCFSRYSDAEGQRGWIVGGRSSCASCGCLGEKQKHLFSTPAL